MSLIFYFLAGLNFFLVIPRSWTPIQLQRSPEQQNLTARPTAIDTRFKSGGFVAVAALFVICYGLGHSIHRYCPRPAGGLRRSVFYLDAAPPKFKIAIVSLFIKVGYTVASSFEWAISPLKYDVNSGWIYGLGYAPSLLIIAIFNVYGYIEENEDQLLIAQRAERGYAIDSELGLERKKPSWWRKMRPDYRSPVIDEHGKIKSLVTEIGGGRPTQRNLERYIELGNMRTHYTDSDDHQNEIETDDFATSSKQAGGGDITPSDKRRSDSSILLDHSPQKVRSMLDI
jgi:hypothetical protein